MILTKINDDEDDYKNKKIRKNLVLKNWQNEKRKFER